MCARMHAHASRKHTPSHVQAHARAGECPSPWQTELVFRGCPVYWTHRGSKFPKSPTRLRKRRAVTYTGIIYIYPYNTVTYSSRDSLGYFIWREHGKGKATGTQGDAKSSAARVLQVNGSVHSLWRCKRRWQELGNETQVCPVGSRL